MLLRYAVRYGLLLLCEIDDGNGGLVAGTVLDYILSELRPDGIELTVPRYRATLDALLEIRNGNWIEDRASFDTSTALPARERQILEGREEIRRTAQTVSQVQIRDKELIESADAAYYACLQDFDISYALKRLLSHPDDEIREVATELAAEKYTLSKIHTKYAHVETEQEQLIELVPRAIFEYRAAILSLKIDRANEHLRTLDSSDVKAYTAAMQELLSLHEQKKSYAQYLGERIIIPVKH